MLLKSGTYFVEIWEVAKNTPRWGYPFLGETNFGKHGRDTFCPRMGGNDMDDPKNWMGA